MKKDNKFEIKIYEHIPRSFAVPIDHRAKEEIFKTKDEECIYSKGYPSACNFEFYPTKQILKILYPFPSYNELKELGITHYAEHVYGTPWHQIAPDLITERWSSYLEEEKDLRISEQLHEALIEYFIKEHEDNNFVYSRFSEELEYVMEDYCDEAGNPINDEEEDEHPLFNNKILKMFIECEESIEVKHKIGMSQCSVQRKINSDGFMDIELSINLSKLHYEICSILCSDEMGYSISEYFCPENGIEGFMCDASDYGLYINLNLNDTDFIKVKTHFPWTRSIATGDQLIKDIKNYSF